MALSFAACKSAKGTSTTKVVDSSKTTVADTTKKDTGKMKMTDTTKKDTTHH